MCANFVYDLNGEEGPNQVGKDVGFITAFYNKNPVVVAPIPYKSDDTGWQYTDDPSTPDASQTCKAISTDLRVPDRDEMASLFVNSPLIVLSTNPYLTNSVISAGAAGYSWFLATDDGERYRSNRTDISYIRCIYR